ncbi:MAG TPA: ABC transporter permease [Anaerolineaceae bacterium]|nr:ABC transporter permease [Anaerolineaceae bacterium]HPN54175.1 ABC transporter permease [Anaerolineaceae bacterium]
MNLIIKTLIKNLLEKKARTCLVLFSIAISAALFFANQGFSLTCQQMFLDASVRWGGNADLYIEPLKSAGAAEWIDISPMETYRGEFAYQFNFIRQNALYMPSVEAMVYYTLIGADIHDFNAYNPITLKSGSFDDWQGFKLIMGEAYAQKYGFSTGDQMPLELNGQTYEFTIAGISEQKGLFLRELADGGYLITPRETLAKIYGDHSNLVFIQLKNPAEKARFFNELSEKLPGYAVHYAVDDGVVAAEVANYVMPFNISAAAVIFMSMFIIFTAFNLISLERISVIGTLRSIGCTRWQLNLILMAESAVLGVLGGLLGCVLGLGVLEIIKNSYFSSDQTVYNVRILLGVKEVLISTGMAALITVISAILPVLKTTRIPIKNIILRDLEPKQAGASHSWLAGLALLAACLFITPFLPGNFAGMIIGCTLATGVLAGLVLVIPRAVALVSGLAHVLPFTCHEMVLGMRNIRDNHSLLNNIKLFAATIAIVAFMTTLFNSLTMDLVRSYNENVRYDISLVLRQSDQNTLAALARVEGVERFVGSYQTAAMIANKDTWFNTVYGIDDAAFFQLDPAVLPPDFDQAMQAISQRKAIIVTNIMKAKYGIQQGDELLIRFGNHDAAYTVAGFVDTNVCIGHVGYISSKNFKEEMGVTDYSNIAIKTSGDPAQAKDNIKRALTKEVMSIQTRQEQADANLDKVNGIFSSISSYTYIAMFVGVIGIINNIVAGFIERKRNFALYRCVGMSKKGIQKMLITETVLIGVLGVTFGILVSLVMMTAIPVSVSVFWGTVKMIPASREIAILAVVSILAMAAVSYVPTLESSQLSILETIKYE